MEFRTTTGRRTTRGWVAGGRGKRFGMSLREDYDLPQRTSLGLRLWIVMGIVPLAALVLWLVAPSSPVTVAVLVVAILVLVGGGVAWAMSARDLRRPPGRHPQTPPSVRGS
jgi:hypothetical protein